MINFLIIFNGMFGIDNDGQDNFFDLCLVGCGGEKKEDKKPDSDIPAPKDASGNGCTSYYCSHQVSKDSKGNLSCTPSGTVAKVP